MVPLVDGIAESQLLLLFVFSQEFGCICDCRQQKESIASVCCLVHRYRVDVIADWLW